MKVDIDQARLDGAMRKMFEQGFRYGYEFGKHEMWILAGKDSPQTAEPVEVTILLPDGTRRKSQSKYVAGRWTAKTGEVIAWRPDSLPFMD